MAKIKFGMMMTDARGKLGGQVFSKNRSGAYIRTKVTPVNPRTQEQQLNRSLLGALSQQWSTLTDAERATFNEGVSNWAKSNIFGDSVKPTGKNLFLGLSKNAISAGYSALTTIPEKVEMPIVVLEEAELNLTSNELVVTATGTFTGFAVTIRATPQMTQGTTFTKGKYRDIITIQDGVPSASLAYDAYIARFGVPLAGGNISVELVVTAETGQKIVPQTIKAVVIV